MPAVTRNELAAQLGISPNRVTELFKMRIIPRLPGGEYDLETRLSKYSKYREIDGPSKDVITAKAGLIFERTKQTFVKVKRLSSDLIHKAVIETWHTSHRAALASVLSYAVDRIPTKLTGLRDAREVAFVLHAEIPAILDAVADTQGTEEFYSDHLHLRGLVKNYTFDLSLEHLVP
jgi:hypothetical protein